MSYSGWIDGLSKCAAELLNINPAFNTDQTVSQNQYGTIKMLPPSLAAPPNAIRLRFEVTDPDGLHQALLLTNETEPIGQGGGLLGCKLLNGQSSTVEFITTGLTLKNKVVTLQIIDVFGSFVSTQGFPIDISSLLPPSQVVSIPDPHLAAAVRQALNLSSSQTLTTHAMLDLKKLSIDNFNNNLINLTGLEHAHNLRAFRGYNISDFSVLSELTQLKTLGLSNSNISDISFLAGLTQLRALRLKDNNISDITTLADLTQLDSLILDNNNISDITPLAGLTQLRSLYLVGNSISDISPLTGMTQLIALRLWNNSISDVSSLVALNLTNLNIHDNPLSYVSINTHIPAMQAKGVEVLFENVAHPALLKISGNSQEAIAGSVLPSPFVVEAQDENGNLMPGVSVNFSVLNGVVNSDDLALVMAALENTPTAPAAAMTAENLQRWIGEAKQFTSIDATFLRGIEVLEQLLATLLPQMTALLANFPNPFNPETWVPYHLAKPTEVTLHIYAVDGALARTLSLGQKSAGIYEHQTRAASWDGRNAQGERVASGIYFYTLTAGDFISTRKMLIRK